MRRLLTTLMIVLVVLVAGLSALVLLINPNDFRSYMIQQVEQRSGYRLVLEGPLRWHVWPQLSILSGRMSLTAPGASAPLVSADNMRLDVALFPLISHKLQVQQVMLKKAVIQLTPQSETRRLDGAPATLDETRIRLDEHRSWSFDIGRLEVADSVLVFQHANDEQITVRNIQLHMEQKNRQQAQVSMSGYVTRDQRELTLALEASLKAGEQGRSPEAIVSRLEYQLKGADLPKQGIQGKGSLNASWDENTRKVSVSNLSLSANDSLVNGTLSVLMGSKPFWQIHLASDQVNLDTLVVHTPLRRANIHEQQEVDQSAVLPRPVISGVDTMPEYSLLHNINADATLLAKNVRWRGLDFSSVNAHFLNQDSVLTIKHLDGGFGKGSISLPGQIDARGKSPSTTFKPQIKNIELAPILHAFNYPLAVSGTLSMHGEFSGDSIDAEVFREHWQGSAQIEMSHSRLEGMNFQQLVQRAVTRSNNDVEARKDYDDATVMTRFSASANLVNGELQLQQMEGESAELTLTGDGVLNLVNEQCDANFAVRVTGGWRGKGALINALRQTTIPLHIYGPWSQLNYKIEIDRILRNQLQDEAKRRLKSWADNHQDDSKARDVQELLKTQ